MIIMHRLPYIALVSFALLLSSCDSSGSSTDDDPTSPSTAARKVDLAPGDQCAYGGVLVQTGIDENRNGTLDDDEVDASEAVCNGAPGADGATGDDGLTSLLERTDLAPGEQCAYGGVLVQSGIDDNRDGVLDELEVDESEAVCNGAPGDSVLYAEETNSSPFHLEACPLGGTEGQFGIDTNGNGTLEAEEVNVAIAIDCYEAGQVLADEVTTERWSARNNHSSVVFDGKLWVIGGDDGTDRLDDVWSSSDGVTWEETSSSAAWSARRGHSSVVFDDKLWVIGGNAGSGNYFDDVWSSEDGVTWEEAEKPVGESRWSARQYHSSVVFDGKMWVIGGTDGSRRKDVWSSEDGASWTPVTTTAGWDARSGHSSVVYDDKLWVLGGDGGSGNYFDDVWSSSAGTTWTAATASAGWPARRYHSSVVFNNRMWMLAGYDGTNSLGDVWSSTDGANWTNETPSDTHWSGRSAHSSVVFDGHLWVLGGQTDIGRVNDVWVYAP